MRSPRAPIRTVTMVLLLAALPIACWAVPVSTEVGRGDVDRPRSETPDPGRDRPDRGAPDAGGGTADDGALLRGTATLPEPLPGPSPRGDWEPGRVTIRRGQEAAPFGRLVLLPLEGSDARAPATLEFRFLARTAADATTFARVELAARTTLDAPLRNGRSLRDVLEGLGCDVGLEVDGLGIALELRAPEQAVQDALRACGQAFGGGSMSPAAVADQQRAAITELARAWRFDPTGPTLDRLLQGRSFGVNARLTALRDAAAVEVALTQREVLHPGRLRLTACVHADAEAAGELVRRSLRAWTAAAAAGAAVDPSAAPPLESGSYVAPLGDAGTPQTVLAVLLVAPPDATPSDVAPLPPSYALLAAVVAPGRLRQRLRRALPEIPLWQSIERASPRGLFRGLRTRAEYGTALGTLVETWRTTAEDAAGAREAPARDALYAAAARARLRLLDRIRTPAGVAREAGAAWNGGLQPADVLAAFDRPGELPVQKMLVQLAGTAAVALQTAPGIEDAQGLPAPGEDVVVLADTVLEPGIEVARVEPERLGAAGGQILEQAFEAVGGRRALLRLDGFSGRSTTRTGAGPQMAESVFATLTGRFRRVRTVLSTMIETAFDGAAGPGVERIGSTTQELPDQDRAAILLDLARHPLVLLRDIARSGADGLSRWRLVAEQEDGGRTLRIVEDRSADGGAWTRLGIDAESHLLRRVWSRTLDTATGRWLDRRVDWRDWRDAGGGLRAPFWRTEFEPGGDRGRVTLWETFRAGAPDQAQLEPGGPADVR